MKPRLAYIAGRYRSADAWGVEQNIRAAEAVAYEVAKLGLYPVCPHTNTRGYFESVGTDEFWLAGTIELLRRCDVVVMVPGWGTSVGACAEKAEAERLGIPVFQLLTNLEAWLREQS